MAIPLSDAGTQVGLVYFENNQMAHAFTQNRMLFQDRLHQSDLTASVRKVLQDTQFPPERLELEITESLLMQNQSSAVQTMNQLKQLQKMGCDTIQGYYFSRPIKQADVARWISNSGIGSDNEIVMI